MRTLMITITAMGTTTATGTTRPMSDAAIALKLQSWFSPAFPIGAFSYSHGLEAAIEAGDVTNRESMEAWLETLLTAGSAKVDAQFFAGAHRAAPDAAAAASLAQEAAAWVPTAELLLEAEHQGDAFLATVRAAWPAPALDAFADALTARPHIAVAAGFAAGAHQTPLNLALPLFLQAFVANVISAGVRLIPLGQTDGQKATAALENNVSQTAVAALQAEADALWTTTPAHDIYSMLHETQYARIFRS